MRRLEWRTINFREGGDSSIHESLFFSNLSAIRFQFDREGVLSEAVRGLSLHGVMIAKGWTENVPTKLGGQGDVYLSRTETERP